MNRHKFWFFVFSAFSLSHSLAGVVFIGLAAYSAICEQPGKSLAMVMFSLLCALGSIGYFQWAEHERDRYF